MSNSTKSDDRSGQLADQSVSKRSKRSEDLAKKQHEFLKGFKKDGKQSLNDSNLSDSSLQSDKFLDYNCNFQSIAEPSIERSKSKLIYVNKSDGERLIDLHKSQSMNSRKLLRSIISRNMLTKINLPNLHLSIEDLSEESNRIQQDKNYEEMDYDSKGGENEPGNRRSKGKFNKDDSLESSKLSSKSSSSKQSSSDGSRDSSINNSKDSLNDDFSRADGQTRGDSAAKDAKASRKRNGKQRKGTNKRAASKDDLLDEKENQEDLTCSSEPTEVLNEREKRRSVGYPGLAFGFSIFSSNTMMRFRLISNELHNIQNVQLKRVIIRVALSGNSDTSKMSCVHCNERRANLINHSCRLYARSF